MANRLEDRCQRRRSRLFAATLSLIVSSAVLATVAAPAGAAATARLSGTVAYADATAAAGVEVDISSADVVNGSFWSSSLTDPQGSWSSEPLEPGSYRVTFVVIDSSGGTISQTSEAFATVALGDGEQRVLSTTLSGPKGRGAGTLQGTLTGIAGFLDASIVTITSTDGAGVSWAATADAGGRFTAVLPAGTYAVTTAAGLDDAQPLDAAVTISAGVVTQATYQLVPLAVPAGIASRNAQRDLDLLNAERARWGLPAGIVLNETWSQACAAHDAYQQANGVLQHEERPGDVGYSPGGAWAGTHSVLSSGGPWSADGNPWEDAPIHLIQLMTPQLQMIGIDESTHGYACATTWPGIGSGTAAPGTVLTYPGDGTRGLPPAENAAELPFVPGDFVGIPEGTIAGRELFVYELGAPATIASASLSGPAGPVAIKWVDKSTDGIGGYLTGAIILPVAPLAAHATYTATVTLKPWGGLPQITHSWSFTTGHANPDGGWLGPATMGDQEAPGAMRKLALTHVSVTPERFRVAKRRTAVVAKARRGTAFRFRLSDEATVRIAIARVGRGLRRGHACVRPTRRLRRMHAKRCVRARKVGTLVRRHQRRGAHRVPFTGHIGRRALAAGRYRATFGARSDTRRSRAVRRGFVVVGGRRAAR